MTNLGNNNTNEVKSIVIQSADWYNPYFFNGKEVDRIRFYNEGGEIVSVNWFGSSNDYPELHFPFDIRRAIKLNFDKKDAFYMKAKDWLHNPNRIDIYIYAPLVNLQHLGESKHEYATSIQYKDDYSVAINSSKKGYSLNKTTDKFEVTVLNIEERIIEFAGNYRLEKNEEGKRLAKIIEVAKECGFNWSESGVKNLEKRFELKFK